MKSKKIPRKFTKKPKTIEVSQAPGFFARLGGMRLSTTFLVPEKEIVAGFLCGCLVVGIAFSSFRLMKNVEAYQEVLREKKVQLMQKEYWQKITKDYPSYRDAHFRLGVLAYQEGKNQEAKQEVVKALDLDPSFVEARIFLQKIKE